MSIVTGSEDKVGFIFRSVVSWSIECDSCGWRDIHGVYTGYPRGWLRLRLPRGHFQDYCCSDCVENRLKAKTSRRRKGGS